MRFPTLSEIDAQMARLSLAEFTKQAWHIVEPDTPLQWNWSMQVMCDHVQALLDGTLGKKNLMLCVPPGSSKSTIVSVMAPAWRWIDKPAWRGLFVSGARDVSIRDSMKCKDILYAPWYREQFRPQWNFDPSQNSKTYYKNTATGFRRITTSNSRVTGERPFALFIDDPLDASKAHSKTERDAINTAYKSGFANRVSDPVNSTRCIIMQRLHADDLIGHLLTLEPDQWELVMIPQIWEENRRFVTSLGWTDPRKQDGELMFPTRFNAEWIATERNRLGSSDFDGQHQQRPSSAEGEIFRRGFIKLMPRTAPLPKFTRIAQSWDTAFKDKQQNDPSAGLMAGEFDKGYWLLEGFSDRMAYPALKEKAKVWANGRTIHALLIEDKASGQSLIQELRVDTKLPVVPIQVTGDKVMRAHAVVPTWEAGNVYVYEDEPWLNDFLDQLYAFPKAAHDDWVDAFTQLINWFRIAGGTGILDFYQQRQTTAQEQERLRQQQYAQQNARALTA